MKKLFAGVGLMLLGAAGAAQADVLPAGMYLRGEAGYSSANNAGFKDNDRSAARCLNCDNSTQNNIGDTALLGVGIGYRFSPMFRTDLTFTYRGWMKLDARDATQGTLKADVDSSALMLNGYFDIPVNLGMFKPYIGGGLGWAQNTVGKNTYTYSAVSAAAFGSKGETDPSNTRDNLAWQLMVGTGIELNKNVTLDIGYRYFDGGRMDMGKGAVRYWNGTSGNSSGMSGDLTSHEVTIGARFSF